MWRAATNTSADDSELPLGVWQRSRRCLKSGLPSLSTLASSASLSCFRSNYTDLIITQCSRILKKSFKADLTGLSEYKVVSNPLNLSRHRGCRNTRDRDLL